MTNEEVIARMWEAYRAGIDKIAFELGWDGRADDDTEVDKDNFDSWLKENFPELIEPSGLGYIVEHNKPLRYNTNQNHDLVCNAHPYSAIGGPMCSCPARRMRVDIESRIPKDSPYWEFIKRDDNIALTFNQLQAKFAEEQSL